MKKDAQIKKFNVKKLKTMKELGDAQMALIHDITSGAMTLRESLTNSKRAKCSSEEMAETSE
ncbi:MAG TPA: hypothetical protein VK603_05995 [Candidatus Saccharimonadales bacterium]|nr:hypothetical protein [Candidatus Saccharimonadales bacterium]